MNLKQFTIHPILKPYINKVWLFESSYNMASKDLRMVVPSGNINLIYTLKGDYQTVSQFGQIHSIYSNNLTFIGQQSSALTLQGDKPVTSIGISFTYTGAYSFFGGQLKESKDLVFDFEEIYYRENQILKEKLYNLSDYQSKVDVLQQFLISKLTVPKVQEPIIRELTQTILASQGLISLTELCQQTGWSKRHLNRIFSEIIGQNIKSWSQTIRFKHNYNLLVKGLKESNEAIKDFYLTYYDQSHYIHSFKKITGKTPNQFMKSINEFGNYFNRIE